MSIRLIKTYSQTVIFLFLLINMGHDRENDFIIYYYKTTKNQNLQSNSYLPIYINQYGLIFCPNVFHDIYHVEVMIF